jgi:hypothetical protein
MATVVNGFNIPGCLAAAAAIETDLSRLANALTEAQFHAPPRSGGWSVGYCLEHLVLTGQAFLPRWDMALAHAVRSGRHEAVLRYGWWRRKMLHLAESPSTLKVKTAAPFEPFARHSIEETVNRFICMHQEFARRVASTRGVDVKRTRVQSPFFSWISYALGFSFDLALAHERRHLCQARQVQRQLLNEL